MADTLMSELGSPEETEERFDRLTRGEPPAPPPGDDPSVVELMRGIEGSDTKFAEVRELTGYDEENLARFQNQANDISNVPALLNRVAEIATVSLCGRKPTSDDISGLLVGDRNLLIMAIRRLTYGAAVEGSMSCPQCFETNDITVDPWVDLEFVPFNPGEFFKDYELRNGSMVTMRLMLAGDQNAAFVRDVTLAERNSVLLERMVLEIDRQNIHAMASTAASATRRLGLADRRRLLEAMAEQPGFQFGKEVEGHCASCDSSLGLRLEVADLLQG